MNAKFSRRTLFAFASAAAAMTAGVKTASASPASVPPIWNGDKMYNSFLKDGTGFSFPHKEGAPVAVVAFDTQCPDCMASLTASAAASEGRSGEFLPDLFHEHPFRASGYYDPYG